MTPLEVLRGILRSLVAMLIYPATLKAVPVSPKGSTHEVQMVVDRDKVRPLKALGEEVTRVFRAPCTTRRMLAMSTAMRGQYRQKLQDSPACMLPSFCHTLPTGQEKGTFIALDVGGSTFRVGLVQLCGRAGSGKSTMYITRMSTSQIDESVRKLPSGPFFDWMASKIEAMLAESKDDTWSVDDAGVLPLGLAWSFPIEQTSQRGGKMQEMGKGFHCHRDAIGQDLGELIESACARRRLKVRVDAIVNDSSATLLSQAYLDPSTSMGLIVGTGTNAAAYLPTSCIGKDKFGHRDASWFAHAEKVITNTELSMFGKTILPETRWDDQLNRAHQLPDFQPLEYMTTGRYLGELFRLITSEAVETSGLFNGILPEALREPYSLDTQLLAKLEQDRSQSLARSIALIQKEFGLRRPPTRREVSFLRTTAEAVSHRAAAYLAVAVHALWALQKDTEINPTTPQGTPRTSIACNGSVILKYPGFMNRCERYIGRMVSAGGDVVASEKVVLERTDEAAVLGAAVAVALVAEAT